MRIIAVVQSKGGVGKTTTAANVAAELASRGFETLLIDLDPQGHCSEIFGLEPSEFEHTMADVLMRTKTLAEVSIPLRDKLRLAPSNRELAEITVELNKQRLREYRLKNAIDAYPLPLDFVICDSPPNLDVLTVNVLSAATEVIAPMTTEYLSLRGTGRLLDIVKEIRDDVNPGLLIRGILPTKVERTAHARDVMTIIREDLDGLVDQGQPVLIFDPIPKAVAVADASTAGQALREFAPNSPANFGYVKLVDDLLGDVNAI